MKSSTVVNKSNKNAIITPWHWVTQWTDLSQTQKFICNIFTNANQCEVIRTIKCISYRTWSSFITTSAISWVTSITPSFYLVTHINVPMYINSKGWLHDYIQGNHNDPLEIIWFGVCSTTTLRTLHFSLIWNNHFQFCVSGSVNHLWYCITLT